MASAASWYGIAAMTGVAVTILLSGVLRGFTGFGFALFSVPILSSVLPPTRVIPLLMGLQLLSGLQTLRGDLEHIAWRSVVPLMLGAIATTWLGALLLVLLPAAQMRVAIGVVVVMAALGLAAGLRGRGPPGWPITVATGALSGVLNGMSAMGGPPLVVYFLGFGTPPAAARSSMTFLFAVMGGLSLALSAWSGLVDVETWLAIPLLLPFLAAGTWFGARLFRRATAQSYRHAALAILLVVAVISIMSGLRG